MLQIETAGTGGIRARIRRVASYATAVRSVGRSGRETNPKLTCHLDPSVGGPINVLSTIAFLHGLADDELTQEELDCADEEYQLLLSAKAVKEENACVSR